MDGSDPHVLRYSYCTPDYILGSWMLDEAVWPAKRTRAMFEKWFDVSIHSMVFDFAGVSRAGGR